MRGTKDTATLKRKLLHELKAVGLASLYFGCWLAALVIVKQLILAEYQIEFSGMSKVLVGTLVLAKVVLVLEHVSLGAWIRAQPAWADVTLRTGLYALGVFIVVVLEKAFEGRHEYGGFSASLQAVFQHANAPHVLANMICIAGALLGYNVLSVIRKHHGEGGLLRMFLRPLPQNSEVRPT